LGGWLRQKGWKGKGEEGKKFKTKGKTIVLRRLCEYKDLKKAAKKKGSKNMGRGQRESFWATVKEFSKRTAARRGDPRERYKARRHRGYRKGPPLSRSWGKEKKIKTRPASTKGEREKNKGAAKGGKKRSRGGDEKRRPEESPVNLKKKGKNKTTALIWKERETTKKSGKNRL